jgi:hypothetical protein
MSDLERILHDDLQLFFGDANPAVTRVYARLPVIDPGLRLVGTLRGPRSRYAHTLEVTAKFRSLPGQDSLVAEAILTDACYWSPELPYLYQAHVELWQGDQWVATVERPYGVRPLAIRGTDLVYASKRFVLRAVGCNAATDEALATCRELGAALYRYEPSDDLCERATEIGVLVVAEVSGSPQHLTHEIKRLARWPAVGLAVCMQAAGWPMESQSLAPNLLLSQWTPQASTEMKGERVCFVPFDSLREGSQAFMSHGGPIVVVGELSTSEEDPIELQLSTRRKSCDELQGHLAKLGQFAGYVAL